MTRVILCIAILALVIPGCSNDNNGVGPTDYWFGPNEIDGTWFEIDDPCSYHCNCSREIADSICQDNHYERAIGYRMESCYVGGERGDYISGVCCTLVPEGETFEK